MQIGTFTIEQLSEGQFQIGFDGTVTKTNQLRSTLVTEEDIKFVAPIGVDPILIIHDEFKILLDAGLGLGLDYKNNDPKTSNIKTNLEVFNLKPEDITHVVLSHLHYDHIGGLTYTDQEFRTQETLPNATYFVQKREWDFAVENFDRPDKNTEGIGYQIDDLFRLVAKKKFVFVEQDHYELTKGIDLIWTGGHTPGHQIVRISDDANNVAYYFGDMIPSEELLNYSLKKMDIDNRQNRQMKLLWLRQAYKENAYLIFYHSIKKKFGKLSKDRNRKYVLQ